MIDLLSKLLLIVVYRGENEQNKKLLLKTSKGKIVTSSLSFCAFVEVSLYCFVLLVLFVLLVCSKSFRKKIKFKTTLISSFILVLNS